MQTNANKKALSVYFFLSKSIGFSVVYCQPGPTLVPGVSSSLCRPKNEYFGELLSQLITT